MHISTEITRRPQTSRRGDMEADILQVYRSVAVFEASAMFVCYSRSEVASASDEKHIGASGNKFHYHEMMW